MSNFDPDEVLAWWTNNRAACQAALPPQGGDLLETYYEQRIERNPAWIERHLVTPILLAKSILWYRRNAGKINRLLPYKFVTVNGLCHPGRPCTYQEVANVDALERAIAAWVAGGMKIGLAEAYIRNPLRKWQKILKDLGVEIEESSPIAHTCHAIGCSEVTPEAMLMCRPHWAMVPAAMKRAVLATYRPGQEVDKTPSKEWAVAAREAIAAVKEKEDAKLASRPVEAPQPAKPEGDASGQKTKKTKAPARAKASTRRGAPAGAA